MRTAQSSDSKVSPDMAQKISTDEVIDAIYAQAAGEGYWSEVLTLIEGLTESHGAFFTGHNIAEKRPLFRLSSDALHITDSAYNDRVYLMNDRLQKLLTRPAGSFILGDELTSNEDFENSIFYNEFMREHGLYYTAGGILENDGETAITFGTIRTREEGDFRPQQIGELKSLLRHVHRAFKLRQTIESRDRSLRALQDSVPFSIFVLNSSGELLDHNSESLRLLDAADGVSILNGRLAFSSSPAQSSLTANLLFARATQQGTSGPDAPAAFVAARPSGLPAFTVACLPVVETSSTLTASLRGLPEPVLIVCVADADRRWNVSTELLRQQYDLTQREAEIVEALTNGLSVDEICAELDISMNTARTHLKRVFQKTGVDRQAELIRRTLSSQLVQRGD